MVDCTQEHHLFISTKHPLTPFEKPHEVLNLAIQNVFYVQSGLDQIKKYTHYKYYVKHLPIGRAVR